MKLFEIDDNSEVKVNTPWVRLIPEFKVLFESTKKIPYDRNTYGRKILAFIYFYLDFSSPIKDWEDSARYEEALLYTNLTKLDVTHPKVSAALEKYRKLQYEGCRALKTYHASMKGLDAMDTYLKSVDFDKVDKQGKAIYTPNQFAANIALTNKAYDELAKLASRVEIELAQSTGIRGKSLMGDREVKAASHNLDDRQDNVAWDENVIAPDGKTKWVDIQGLIAKKSDNNVA